jgi:predicted DNA-binding protein (MmcQ/YjbR family)
MNIEQYRNYCINKKGATESFPFGRAPDALVFKVAGKIFTSTDISTFESINVKCHPDMVDELRANHDAVKIPKYANKRHWNRIMMDNTIADKLIYKWIDDSYHLVLEKLSKVEREKFLSSP